MKSINPTPIHNGQHRYSEPYFEWWYFHFISESGYYFNLLLHPTDIFALHRDPYMSVSMIDPANKLHYFREPLPGNVFDGCDERLLVDHEKLKIEERDDHILLDADVGGFHFRGKVAKDIHPYISNDGVLFQNGSHRNYWFVSIPHGRFELECELNGDRLALEGSAYHDHNWGNAMLQEYFQGWIWSHLVWDGGFLLFYHVLTSGGTIIKRGLLAHADTRHIIEGFDLEVAREEERLEEMTLPSRMILTARDCDRTIRVEVTADKLFRKREDSDYPGFIPHYYRARCSGSVSVGDRELDALGLVECLRIDSKP